MKAQVVRISIQDARGQPYQLVDPKCFSALLVATIGPEGGEDGDIFYATVCSPSWFADNVLRSVREDPTHEDVDHGPTFGRHYMSGNSFDEDAILAAVKSWVANQNGRYLAGFGREALPEPGMGVRGVPIIVISRHQMSTYDG